MPKLLKERLSSVGFEGHQPLHLFHLLFEFYKMVCILIETVLESQPKPNCLAQSLILISPASSSLKLLALHGFLFNLQLFVSVLLWRL